MPAIFSSPLKSQTNIVAMVDNEIVVMNQDGMTIESSNPKLVGKKYDIEELAKKARITSNSELTVKCPHVNVDIFLLIDKSHLDKCNLNVIKKLSSLIAQQNLQEMRAFKGSTDEFVNRMVDELTESNFQTFESEAIDFGLDLKQSYMVFSIKMIGFQDKLDRLKGKYEKEGEIDKWKKRIKSAVNGFFTRNLTAHVFYRGDDNFVVLKACEPEEEIRISSMLKKSFSSIFSLLKFSSEDRIIVGISSCAAGARHIVRSIRESEHGARIATKLGKKEGAYAIDEFGIIAILADQDNEKTNQFADKVFERIKNDVALETLNIFFSCNLSITETARKLKLHRNTVIYRLNRINELLHLNPRNLDEAIAIKTALLIKQIQ